MSKDLPRVFVGSASESLHYALALQANLEAEAEVRLWNQDLFRSGNSTLEDLLRIGGDFDFAAFIWSSDDAIESRGIRALSPRDNVILEAGMFYGALGRDRVFLLIPATRPKVPTDLAGINHLYFREPSDSNHVAALATVSSQIKKQMQMIGLRPGRPAVASGQQSQPTVFPNIHAAWSIMKEDCHQSATVRVIGNRGLSAFGTDHSLVSLADISQSTSPSRLRIVLLSPDSRWINSGFLRTRAYESIETFKKELRSCHEVIESAMATFVRTRGSWRSGVRYHNGEPKFGLVMTERTVYVNTYAEKSSVQVVDLPIHRFENVRGSLYGAFRRYFDDLWYNQSTAGRFQQEHLDTDTSAGAILLCKERRLKYVALLQRHDGLWVLPKGHRLTTDPSLEHTAMREVEVETGLDQARFGIERNLGSYALDKPAQSKGSQTVHLFLMRCRANGRPLLQSPDFADARWWSLETSMPDMLDASQAGFIQDVIAEEQKSSRPGAEGLLS